MLTTNYKLLMTNKNILVFKVKDAKEFPLRNYFNCRAYRLVAMLQSDLMAVWNLLDRILDGKDASRKTLKA